MDFFSSNNYLIKLKQNKMFTKLINEIYDIKCLCHQVRVNGLIEIMVLVTYCIHVCDSCGIYHIHILWIQGHLITGAMS